MADKQPILEATDPWGEKIVLTEEDIARIDAKRADDIGRYLDEIRETLEDPDAVFEGRYEDSKVFYGRDRLPSSTPFGRCYVAVIVRYSTQPASVRTVYFPLNMSGALGTLIHIKR